MKDELTDILYFVYQFTSYPLALHPYPAPHLEGGEWWDACERIKTEWVAEAPDHWLDLLIGLVAEPPDEASVPAIAWQDIEDRDSIIAELLGRWGARDPDRLFAAIVPRLQVLDKRYVFIEAIGNTYLPQALGYLQSLAGQTASMDEHEVIVLIDSAGDVARHTDQQVAGLELMAQIRANTKPGQEAVLHELELYRTSLEAGGAKRTDRPGDRSGT